MLRAVPRTGYGSCTSEAPALRPRTNASVPHPPAGTPTELPPAPPDTPTARPRAACGLRADHGPQAQRPAPQVGMRAACSRFAADTAAPYQSDSPRFDVVGGTGSPMSSSTARRPARAGLAPGVPVPATCAGG